MTQAVKEAFLMKKKYQELTGLISRDKIDGYKGFVFINSSGHVQHQDTLNEALHKIVKRYRPRWISMYRYLKSFNKEKVRFTKTIFRQLLIRTARSQMHLVQ